MSRKAPFKPLSWEERPDFLFQLSKLAGVDHAEFPALARQVSELYRDAVLAGDLAALDVAEAAYGALVYLLNGGTFRGCKADADSAGYVLQRATAAEPGQVPHWGQSGEFLLEVDGMRVLVKLPSNMLGNHRMLELLAVDLDEPFLSVTGYRSASLTVTNHLGASVESAMHSVIQGVLDSDGKPKLIDIEDCERKRSQGLPEWLSGALSGVGPDGQLAMFGDAPPVSKPKAKSNALRQKELRARRKAQQVKPLLLTESERGLIARLREQGAVEPDAVPIMLTHTDRCVMSLGLLAHEDLDHRNADWEVTKKPGFDALLKKLWPEGDNGRYLAEPRRSSYRPTSYLRGEVVRHYTIAERAKEEMTKLSRRVDELESTLAEIGAAVSDNAVATAAQGKDVDLSERVKVLEREQTMLETERNKAFRAVETLTERLRRAGLSTDYRPQSGE